MSFIPAPFEWAWEGGFLGGFREVEFEKESNKVGRGELDKNCGFGGDKKPSSSCN